MASGVLASIESWIPRDPIAADLSVATQHLACRPSPRQDIRFSTFRLVFRSRTLLRDGEVVALGSRAFDLLYRLASSAGTVISKEELVHEVWPTTTVEESNLRFQMASLRKALGAHRDLIKTIPGRGYLFTGDCLNAAAATLVAGPDPEVERSSELGGLQAISASQLRALIDLLEEQMIMLQAGQCEPVTRVNM